MKKSLITTLFLFAFLMSVSFVIALPIEFGGMYQEHIDTADCLYENPTTDDCSCPTNFSKQIVFGREDVLGPGSEVNDNPIYYCYRDNGDNNDGDYEFGGGWGLRRNNNLCIVGQSEFWYSDVIEMDNLIDSSLDAECPTGFVPSQISGNIGESGTWQGEPTNSEWPEDYETTFCFQETDGNVEFHFGGMYGTGASNQINPITGAKTCPQGYKKRLMQGGTCNFDYTIYYCFCEGTGCGAESTPRGTAYWADITGTSITEADMGDSVLTLVAGENLENKSIETTIYDTAVSEAVWYKPWTWFAVTEEAVESINAPVWITETEGNFQFEANIEKNPTITSDVLTVGSEDNFFPQAEITNPENGFLISENTLIIFQQESYNEDDLLEINWDFGDGNSETFSNYSYGLDSESADTTHTYTSNGIFEIVLTASETEREHSISRTQKVYVFKEGINVIPIISSPMRGEFQSSVVYFDASESYVVDCSTTDSGSSNFTAGNLYCTYIHAPDTKTLTGNYKLTMSWTIYPDGENSYEINGDWNDNYDKVIDFYQFFENSGHHIAELNMEYTAL